MNIAFDYWVKTKIIFKSGVRYFLTDILIQEDWTRVGLMVDHNLVNLPVIKDLTQQIEKTMDRLVVGICSISEPTYDSLEVVRKEFCDDSLQAIIGLGGGSTLDMAKAMAVLLHNKGPAIEYRGFNKMTEPVLPIIAMPTTAGSGSEITPNASFIDTQEKKKLGINGEAIRPHYALLDPELTLSCPKAPTVAAAADSMVHAVEAYAARKTNPMARLFAREGFRQVFEALPGLMKDLGNLELRERVMYGAFLSGIALMHSGTGPAAAMSYPLGVRYGVAHGLGGAIFLPHVVEHNVQCGYTEYADFYDSIDSADLDAPQEVKAMKFLKHMFDLWSRLEIPKNLQFCGYQGTTAHLEEFVRETLELKGALDQNPVPFGPPEIQNLLLKLSPRE